MSKIQKKISEFEKRLSYSTLWSMLNRIYILYIILHMGNTAQKIERIIRIAPVFPLFFILRPSS